jgi:hypothetical protein
MAMGTNKVVLDDRSKAVAEGGGREEKMVNAEEGEAVGETQEVTMAETAAVSVNITAIETETETGGLARNG